jgi:hypothetical protein
VVLAEDTEQQVVNYARVTLVTSVAPIASAWRIASRMSTATMVVSATKAIRKRIVVAATTRATALVAVARG